MARLPARNFWKCGGVALGWGTTNLSSVNIYVCCIVESVKSIHFNLIIVSNIQL